LLSDPFIFNEKNKYDQQTCEKMIRLLEDYIAHLREASASPHSTDPTNSPNYRMPSDTVSPSEWAEFENVYQVHCPQIFMDAAIRDVCSSAIHPRRTFLTKHLTLQILMQYYYCSRARRGLEYHMATRFVSIYLNLTSLTMSPRAVKFIRDQAEAALAASLRLLSEKPQASPYSAQAAAQALRKLLIGDIATKSSIEVSDYVSSPRPELVDPLDGWSDGVSLRKGHFCLLLKPQIVLKSEESVCILAAVQAKLQSFEIMDDSNLDDPISGKVMSR
jgi:hypothetical protein